MCTSSKWTTQFGQEEENGVKHDAGGKRTQRWDAVDLDWNSGSLHDWAVTCMTLAMSVLTFLSFGFFLF